MTFHRAGEWLTRRVVPSHLETNLYPVDFALFLALVALTFFYYGDPFLETRLLAAFSGLLALMLLVGWIADNRKITANVAWVSTALWGAQFFYVLITRDGTFGFGLNYVAFLFSTLSSVVLSSGLWWGLERHGERGWPWTRYPSRRSELTSGSQ